MKDSTELRIKISGGGTKREILNALKKLANSIKNEPEEGLSIGQTFEDSVLITEISEA